MELKLIRQLILEGYEIIMDIGYGQKREELLSVLKLAEENQGEVTAESICNTLLIGRPLIIGKNIINRCQELGLLEHNGRLTEKGRIALSLDEVFIPERGRYKIVLTQDPLIPQRLIYVESISEKYLKDELDELALSKGKDQNTIPMNTAPVQLPVWIKNLEGSFIDLIGPMKEKVNILSMESLAIRCQLNSLPKITLTLSLSENEKTDMRIQGDLKAMINPPKITFREVWIQLLGERASFWDEERNPPALRCNFNELADNEILSFLASIHFEQPHVENIGTFDNTDVINVPVIPKTDAEANKWANWILVHKIAEYQNRQSYEKLKDDILSKFQEYNIALPSQDVLSEQIKKHAKQQGNNLLPDSYWYLQAPIDLSLNEEKEV